MITAIVPARGGSKRMPGKNVKELVGKPLVFHTLDALIGHPEISKVLFTSDSQEYIDLVGQFYGSKVTMELRPSDFASDTMKVYDEIVRLKNTKLIETDWFMLCLPTAPLRNFDTVNSLLDDWRRDGIARFTACEYDFPVQFAFDLDIEGNWLPMSETSPMVTGQTRSQDIPKRYRPNGAIYLQKTKTLGVHKTFYIDAKPLLMTIENSIDIDNKFDFEMAAKIMETKGE